MALTKTQVSRLYITLFGRASEGEGNAYWQTAGADPDMASTADTMLQTEAAADFFGGSLDQDHAFVEHIYQNALGKNWEDDPEGIVFWINRLAVADSRGEVVAALIAAVQDPDNAGAAQTRFSNKVAVSDYTAEHIAEYTDDISFGALIAGVTEDETTVADAVGLVDAFADAQENTMGFTLTPVRDRISGTPGNEVILGTDDTYNENDVIDGGPGIDTLSLMLFSPVAGSAELTGVEIVEIRNAHADTVLDAENWTGVEKLVFKDSLAPAAVHHVQAGLEIVLKENDQDVAVVYAPDVLGSENFIQPLGVTDFTGSISVTAGGSDRITSLDIQAAGTSVVGIAENSMHTIGISGSGDVTMDLPEQVTTVSGADAAGDLVLDMSLVDPAVVQDYFVSVHTGSGRDRITASIHDNHINAGAGDDQVMVPLGLTSGDLLDGGEGFDTLFLSSEDLVAAAADNDILAGLTGFEAVGIMDELDVGTALDISDFGVNAVVIGAGLAGDQTIAGFDASALVEIRTPASETDLLTITMTDATDAGSSDDLLNIAFNADLKAGDMFGSALDIQGINEISVTTADAATEGETGEDNTLPGPEDGYELMLSSDANLNAIHVAGDQAFGFSTTAASTVAAVTARDMTGNMTLDFNTAFGGSQGVDIVTGAGNDTITGSVYGDIIDAGAGDDTLFISTGSDRITGGAGADTFVVPEAGVSTPDSFSRILDFSAVSDRTAADRITNINNTITPDAAGIDVSAAEIPEDDQVEITADVANGIITLNGADAHLIDSFDEWLALAALVTENGATAGFEFLDDTYIMEMGADGTADSLVALSGVVSLESLGTEAGDNTVIVSA
jgi:Ca2+-binding RTX toxin-like protein